MGLLRAVESLHWFNVSTLEHNPCSDPNQPPVVWPHKVSKLHLDQVWRDFVLAPDRPERGS